MPVIRACRECGQKNRIPAKYLASAGRCGNCKSALPPIAEPLAVDMELFDEVIQTPPFPFSWTSGRIGVDHAGWRLRR